MINKKAKMINKKVKMINKKVKMINKKVKMINKKVKMINKKVKMIIKKVKIIETSSKDLVSKTVTTNSDGPMHASRLLLSSMTMVLREESWSLARALGIMRNRPYD